MGLLSFIRRHRAATAAIRRAEAAEAAYFRMLVRIYGEQAETAAMDARGVSTLPLWQLRNNVRAAWQQLAKLEA